jgi:hypothetical protein
MAALEIIRPESKKERELLFGKALYYSIYSTSDKKFPERKEGIRHKIHH